MKTVVIILPLLGALFAGCAKPVPKGMVRIPEGEFTMGGTSGDTDEDAPPVTVYVSEFYMAKTSCHMEVME